MKPTLLLTCVLTALLLVGCESYRESVRSLGSSMGAIQTRDIQQADAYRKSLPGHLGLASKQVRVEPGSGITHVTISGVTDEVQRQRIATELATLNSKNPQLSPLKWRFE
jgi:outer membrane murein-binding lipoprotein Lpp